MTMPRIIVPKAYRTAYLWPGLPQLWMRGSWVGLLVAVGFTALANVLLLATFVFYEWLPQQTRLTGYVALAVVWLLARWQSRAERQAIGLAKAEAIRGDETDEAEDEQVTQRDLLFREAQGHYLRSDWVVTEQVLLKLLKQDARDVESRLMLATLWRHQGRSAEAGRQLDRLERLDAASRWQHEIAAERSAIAEAENGEVENNSKPSEAPQELTEVEDIDHHRGDDDPLWDDRRAA